MTFDSKDQVLWPCPCGSHVPVPASRQVPDHTRPDRRWCRFSYCTLTPRTLAAAVTA